MSNKAAELMVGWLNKLVQGTEHLVNEEDYLHQHQRSKLVEHLTNDKLVVPDGRSIRRTFC